MICPYMYVLFAKLISFASFLVVYVCHPLCTFVNVSKTTLVSSLLSTFCNDLLNFLNQAIGLLRVNVYNVNLFSANLQLEL